MGSPSTADVQLIPLMVAADSIDPEATVYAEMVAPTVDSTAVFEALWEDEEVGYAVLDVLDRGEAFRFANLNAAMATLLKDSLLEDSVHHEKDRAEDPSWQAEVLIKTNEILGETLGTALVSAVAQQFRYPCDHCVHTQQSARFEACLPIAGETRWWQLKARPMVSVTGQVYQLVLSATEITGFKQTEADLQAAIKDTRTLFDNTQEAIFIHDLDGTILDVNERVLKLHQITREEALRFSLVKEFAAPDSPTHLLSDFLQRAAQGEHVEIEWPAIRREDGSEMALEVVLQKVVLSGQDRIMACVRDITERKKIAAEQRRLLDIIEATPDLVSIADAKGNSLHLNRAGQQILGLSEERSTGFHISEMMPAEQRQAFAATVSQAIAQGSWSGESVLLTRTGEHLPVSQVLIAHKDDSGALKQLSVIMRDICALKAVEDKLRDREQFLDSIYSSAEIVIFAWDLVEGETDTFRCSGWNPTCESSTGISAEYALGKTPCQIFGPEQGKSITGNCLKCIETSQPLLYDEEIVLDEVPTWWTTKLNPIRNRAGQIYRIVGTTTNITELKLNSIMLEAYGKRQAQQAKELSAALAEVKRTQSQIVQNEKMSSLGQMVAGIAHEINNPVNFIHANIKPARSYATEIIDIVEQYQKEYPQPSLILQEMIEESDLAFIQEDFLQLLESMRMGTQRIRDIVISLRNFSRLDEADIKAVDIHEGIDSTLIILSHRLRERADQKLIEIVKYYHLLTAVECYPSQLNQVVMNILANAIDVLGDVPEPEIIISTHACDDRAIINITDNGPGMPATVRDHIFDPFFTTKPIGKGTGMGLSICHQIVTEKHGGTLSVSPAPEGGTQFTVDIPLKQVSPRQGPRQT